MLRSLVINLFDSDLRLRANRVKQERVLLKEPLQADSWNQLTEEDFALVRGHIEAWFLQSNPSFVVFYVQLHDNLIKELAFVRDEPNPATFLDQAILEFRRNPAKEGGCSLFGLITPDAQFLITALCEPFCELRVTSYHLHR